MRCFRCGGPVAHGANCCSHCGQPFAPPKRTGGGKRRAASILFAALAVIGAALVGLPKLGVKIPGMSTLSAKNSGGSQQSLVARGQSGFAGSLVADAVAGNGGALDAESQQAEATLSALGEAPASTLAATSEAAKPTLAVSGSAPAPVFQAPASAPGMPKDVFEWLKHLQKCEASRMSIAQSQLASGVALLGNLQKGQAEDALSEEDASKKTGERTGQVSTDASHMRQAWVSLLQEFDRVPAPAECAGLKATYDVVLQKTGSMILDIVDAIANASHDPQGALALLTKMQGTSASQIDQPAKEADNDLGAICRKYETDKWFDVKADFGGGLMSALGM